MTLLFLNISVYNCFFFTLRAPQFTKNYYLSFKYLTHPVTNTYLSKSEFCENFLKMGGFKMLTEFVRMIYI